MNFVYILLACVTIGIGATLLPPVKDITTAIFDSFGGTEGMPPLLALIVNFWPVLIALAFFVGAIFIVKTRQM